MFQPLDGPSLQDRVSVTTSIVKELKVGSFALSERQVITIQPIDGNIWVYFGDGTSTPSASTVSTKGLKHMKMAKESYEAGDKQQVFIVSDSGTVNVTFVERA
jgi:hypothetical protein